MEQENEKKTILNTEEYGKQYKIITVNKNLNSSEKALLVEIAHLSENYGYCFATQESLGGRLGLSKDYIKKMERKLKKEGYLFKKDYRDGIKRASHTTVNRDKIMKEAELMKNMEIRGMLNKDTYIPKKKQELIDGENEVYRYNQGSTTKSFEYFRENRREVVNQWWTNGRYVDEINVKYRNLFIGYVRALREEKKKEGREIDEEYVRTEVLCGVVIDDESTYSEEDFKHFNEVGEIDSLPCFGLEGEDRNERPIRDVILDKFKHNMKLNTVEGRKEEREKRGEEIKKDWKEYFDAIESSRYRIENKLTDEEKNKRDSLISTMKKSVEDNYLIFDYYYGATDKIEGYKDYMDFLVSIINKDKKNIKNKDNDEKKILESKREVIEDKKKELEEIKEVEKIEE